MAHAMQHLAQEHPSLRSDCSLSDSGEGCHARDMPTILEYVRDAHWLQVRSDKPVVARCAIDTPIGSLSWFQALQRVSTLSKSTGAAFREFLL